MRWPYLLSLRSLTVKSGFDILLQHMRKGFGQLDFKSTVGVANGLMGDNFGFTPSLISLTYHNITQERSTP